LGHDLSLTRAPMEPIKRLLSVMRARGFHIIRTREGHRPDLSDLPANKQWRLRQIGDPGPCGRVLMRGEAGREIIPDLAPLPDEPIIDKPGTRRAPVKLTSPRSDGTWRVIDPLACVSQLPSA
jgi:biuret amidohydrolase